MSELTDMESIFVITNKKYSEKGLDIWIFLRILKYKKKIKVMEKEFVPYEQALALKELGFDEPCFAFYDPTNKKLGIVGNPLNYNFISDIPEVLKLKNPKPKDISAPLYQQAFRWFKEKYNLWNMIYPRDGWNYSINRVDETTSCSGESFHSVEINEYEEAELECLKKLIKIVKNK